LSSALNSKLLKSRNTMLCQTKDLPDLAHGLDRMDTLMNYPRDTDQRLWRSSIGRRALVAQAAV